MFSNLKDTVRELNSNVNNAVNCERAKKLKKKLISVGLTMAIIGFLGAIACLVLFITGGVGAVGEIAFASPRILIPFILFIPCGVVGGIGMVIASFGFSIAVTGYATGLINETVKNDKCPKCGEVIASDAAFCPKCGEKIKKVCSQCGAINELKNDYCIKCGKKLD